MTDIASIPPIRYRAAMALSETEAGRLLALVDELDDRDWSRPTDCAEWDVKELLSHVLGGMKADAGTREFLRQIWLATRASRRSERPMIDEMNARQVAEHATMSGPQIKAALHLWAPRAVRGRRITPAPLRAIRVRPGPPFEGKMTVGYIIGIVRTRDLWAHRLDLARATNRDHVQTPEHDGRLVADLVADWAHHHNQPFTLNLTGPAGGTFTQGRDGEYHTLDAVDFCRIFSGRATGEGLLAHSPFRRADA